MGLATPRRCVSWRVYVQGGGQERKARDTRNAVAIQQPYLRVVGIEEEAEGAHSTPVFTWETLPCVTQAHAEKTSLVPVACAVRDPLAAPKRAFLLALLLLYNQACW
jgi:hypothetical protein